MRRSILKLTAYLLPDTKVIRTLPLGVSETDCICGRIPFQYGETGSFGLSRTGGSNGPLQLAIPKNPQEIKRVIVVEMRFMSVSPQNEKVMVSW